MILSVTKKKRTIKGLVTGRQLSATESHFPEPSDGQEGSVAMLPFMEACLQHEFPI